MFYSSPQAFIKMKYAQAVRLAFVANNKHFVSFDATGDEVSDFFTNLASETTNLCNQKK